MASNIHPEFHRYLKRSDKETLLQQKGFVIWLYGLSGSGKSTVANLLERRLHAERRMTKLLDGDNVRTGLNADLGFSDKDRKENIRRIAEVAKLFADDGIITITAFICPKNEYREMARRIIGDDFLEVYVKASYETCAKRDVKGLYAKAAKGEVQKFTGKDSSFEEPEKPEILLDTDKVAVDQSVIDLYHAIKPRLGH